MVQLRRRISCVLLGCLASVLNAQEIANWSAPPFWSPAEKAVSKDGVSTQSAEAVAGLPTSPVPFVGIAPCRIVDTRGGTGFTGAYGPPALGGNATARVFNVPAGPCPGIPADAAAFSINIAAILPAADGFLTAFPTGGTQPNASTLNYLGGEVVANAAVIAAGTSGSISVFVNVTTHVIIDINGYYTGSAVTSVTAGTGLTGGGTGAVTLGIAAGGVGSTELATGAVTSTKIGANAVTAGAIASGQVVKSLNGLRDTVSLAGSDGITVTPGVGTITIGSSGGAGAPAGSFVLGNPGDSTIIGAGFTEAGPSNVDVWSPTTTSGAPTVRNEHQAVWTGTKMIVWGGYDSVTPYLNTGGQYDPATNSWAATTATGAPSARQFHTAVWTGSRMIVWGGFDGTYFNTGGQYDPVGNSWTATTTTGAPAARREHTAVWTGSRMIVWGGFDGVAPYVNTGGQYDPIGNSWTATTTTGAPAGRNLHTAVWTGSKMIVWGGFNGADMDTGGQYDPAGNSWTATSTTGAPAARREHTAVWSGTKVIVWGGLNGPNYLNTGGQYDPVGDNWGYGTSITEAPTGRFHHTAVWTGSRMIVWGGYDGIAPHTSSGGLFDAANNSWASTTTAGAPSGRYSHTAVWTGSRMIVWGGVNASGHLNTGGRYTILSLYVKN